MTETPKPHKRSGCHETKVSEVSGSLKKVFFFVRVLDIGVRVKGIALFGFRAVSRGAGIVRHKKKMAEGKYRGCYIIGIETCGI